MCQCPIRRRQYRPPLTSGSRPVGSDVQSPGRGMMVGLGVSVVESFVFLEASDLAVGRAVSSVSIHTTRRWSHTNSEAAHQVPALVGRGQYG